MKLKSDREMSSLTNTKIKVGNGHCCVFAWLCGFSRIFIYLIGEIKARVLQGWPLLGHVDRNAIFSVISLMDSVKISISLYDNSVSGYCCLSNFGLYILNTFRYVTLYQNNLKIVLFIKWCYPLSYWYSLM